MTKKLVRNLLMAATLILLLMVVRPVEVRAMPRPCGKYAWTQTDMCLRSYQGLGGDIVAVVHKGAELVVISTDDNAVDGFYWAMVRYSDTVGYMAYANENQTSNFIEFQSWNSVEGTSGWARLLIEVTLYSGPNPELSKVLATLDKGQEVQILKEMAPVKYGSNICRVQANGMEGYIPANNEVAHFYEYSDNSESSKSAAPTTDAEIDKLGIVNRPMCLRAMPNKNSEILRVADTFEELWVEALEVNASGEKWYRVINGTDEAYVADFGVNVGGKTLDRDAETVTALNLRSGPSTAAQVWVTLPEGLPVWAMRDFSGVGTSEKWIRVAVDYEGHKYYGFVVGWGLNLIE
jgi:uncharacterized protein YgiM (DUF1202 family)